MLKQSKEPLRCPWCTACVMHEGRVYRWPFGETHGTRYRWGIDGSTGCTGTCLWRLTVHCIHCSDPRWRLGLIAEVPNRGAQV